MRVSECKTWNFRLVTLLMAGLLVCGPSRAQTQMPDTPAGRQFAAWLDAFNSGDRAVLRKFFQENFPERAKNLDDALNFRRRTGGFEFIKAESSEPLRLTGVIKERASAQRASFTIEVEAEEPHRIADMSLQAVPPEAEARPTRMSEHDALAATRSRLDQDAAAGRFSGAVLVAKNGKPVFTGAYGLADRARNIANRLDTQFRIGSMNKMFTAVAVLQLAQQGKVHLDDPLGKYLPDYPNTEVASKVTIHYLLTHTGGTGDIFTPEYEARRLETRTLSDYVTLFGKRGLQFQPGARWEYSNYGFILLGVLIQRVTGESYYDYVREHVYKPAGMLHSDSLAENELGPGAAIGYTKPEGGDWRLNTDTLPYRGTSAGGGYSTVGDLLNFANALAAHKLLDPHFTELLTTGKVETPRGFKYAYGFGDRMADGVRSFGHGGGAPGMNGDLEIYPRSGYVIAVLANVDPPAAQQISDFIGNCLPAE